MLRVRCKRMSKVSKSVAAVAGVGIVVAVIVIPSFFRARSTPAMNWCVNNLRQLDGAKQERALENRRTNGDAVTWDDVKPFLKNPPVCSRGGVYMLGRVGELPRCSIGGDHSLPPETNR
jgi:hypothetical protein